ncbi:MAG: HAD-IIIA family hydrolase [Cyanobacteria bacterium P01_D01_bin.115]
MKLLLLDKDGTLTTPKSGAKFVQHPEDQELLPGVIEAIRHYDDTGWNLAIASNQGGVAAGHKTLEDAALEMRYCISLLRDGGIQAIEINAYFCPDFEGMKCGVVKTGCYPFRFRDDHLKVDSYRKPNAGMIQAAIYDLAPFFSELEEALFVGDRPEDEEAASNAGVQFMWAEAWRNTGIHN